MLLSTGYISERFFTSHLLLNARMKPNRCLNTDFRSKVLNKIELQNNENKIRDLESNVHEHLESISVKNARIKQLESALNEYKLKEARKKESPFYKIKKDLKKMFR